MALLKFIQPDDTSVEIEASVGQSVMNAATMNGVDGIEAQCGGGCMCATCHVYVEQGLDAFPPASANEEEMLDAVSAERRPNSRLSCQLQITDALDVARFVIPPAV